MKQSSFLKKIYSKNYIILMCIGFLPLIWKVLEIATLYGFENSLKILGQIALVGIIFKVFEETLLNPLYKTLNKNNFTKDEEKNYIAKKFLIYYFVATFIFSFLVFIFIEKIMIISKVPEYIFSDTIKFIKCYVVASGLGVISKFLYTFSVICKNTKKMFIYLLIKAILTAILLVVFVPKFMLGFGVLGVAIAEIIVNLITIVYLFFTFPKTERNNDNKFNLKNYFKLMIVSFFETMVRNVVYYFVILVFLNMLDNQDLYFVANEYIWSIMLVPILAQNTLIKQDIANNKDYSLTPYFKNSVILIIFMVILIPISILLFKFVYGLENYMEYFYVLLKLFPCYIIFAFDAVVESYFFATGKLHHILVQTILTNILVYLTAYILYLCNVWIVTLNSIILLFNLGVFVSSLYTISVFLLEKKKEKANKVFN